MYFDLHFPGNLDVGHLFIHLLGLSKSPLERCLSPLPMLKIGYLSLFVLPLSRRAGLYILDINSF